MAKTVKKAVVFCEEFAPLLVFFLLNAKGAAWLGRPASDSLFIATAGFMLALGVALMSTFLRGGKLKPATLISAVFVLIFGGLTLFLQNEIFIKAKPTIIYMLFAAILFFGLWRGESYLQKLLGTALPLTQTGWLKLTRRWGYFFIFCAGLNEFVRLNFSTDIWVQVKTFGYLPLTFIFMLAQAPLLAKHAKK